MKIYQHVDELNERDGIGNDIRGFHFLFEELGIQSSIVTRINNSKDKLEVHSISKAPKFYSDDVHILHYGGAGYPLDFFVESAGRKILRFHNMTPIYFFKKFLNDDIFKTFERNETRAILELYSLHKSIEFVLSDSLFNEQEYFKIVDKKDKVKMSVLPVIRNYPLRERKKSPGYRIGFLGRWAPNKKLEDLLFTLFYQKKIHPEYKLILLGKKNQIFNLYNNQITNLITELELSESIEIYENLDDAEMNREMLNLDLYLSMSEHEGFGIPILEAMSYGIPVIAFSSSAVIETVSEAGILFTKKEFPLVAELIHKIATSSDLKNLILKKQSERVMRYNNFPFKEKLLDLLQK